MELFGYNASSIPYSSILCVRQRQCETGPIPSYSNLAGAGITASGLGLCRMRRIFVRTPVEVKNAYGRNSSRCCKYLGHRGCDWLN